MSHHDNLKINQQNFENGFDSDNVDWLSIPLERHEINTSDLNIIDSPNSFFVLLKTRKVTNNSHSRIVKKMIQNQIQISRHQTARVEKY